MKTKKKPEVCNYNHLLLYAKNHYVQGDVVEDVRKILAHRCCVSPEYITDKCVWEGLVNALDHYGFSIKVLQNLFKPMPDEPGYLAALFDESCPFARAVRLVLSEISTLKVKEMEGVMYHNLGTPDPNILPLNKK